MARAGAGERTARGDRGSQSARLQPCQQLTQGFPGQSQKTAKAQGVGVSGCQQRGNPALQQVPCQPKLAQVAQAY